MQYYYTPYIIPLLVSILISGWVTVFTWRRRSMPGSAALAMMAFFITEWTLGYVFEIAGADLAVKIFWGKAEYIGIAMIPLTWAVFAYYHTHQGERPKPATMLMLAIVPLVTILLAFTTEYHQLIWKTIDIEQSGTFSALAVEYGLWFWVHSVYSYILLAGGTVLIFRSLLRAKGLYLGQTVALIIAVLAPWIGNILYLSGLSPIPHLDLTPFAFTISVTALVWGIFGFQLGKLSPIARDLIVDGMQDGMIAVDATGQIADINPAAARMIGLPAAQVIGKSLKEVLSPWPHLAERFQNTNEGMAEIVVGEGEASRRYEVRISALNDTMNRIIGRIIAVHALGDGAIPTPRFAERETAPQAAAQFEAETEPAKPSSIPILGAILSFIQTPVKTDLVAPPDTNPKWYQARERSFTLILRVSAILGTIALLIAPSFQQLKTGLPFAIIIGTIWVLGLARSINFTARTVAFLALVYMLATIETYNFGYSVAAFSFYMTLVVTATLLLGRSGGIATLFVTVATIGTFGILIGSGQYLPVSAHEGIPTPRTIQRALTSLLAFTASASALIASVTILMESLNKAWRMETQALNLLQQERDLLEQRVTERTRDLANTRDEAIKISNELRKYYRVIEQSGNSILVTTTNGSIEYANPRLTGLTGYTTEELIGKNPRILQSGNHGPDFYKDMWATISSGNIWHGEIHNRRKDGSLFWELATIAPVLDQNGQITNYVAIKEDITAQKELQEQLRQQNEQMATEITERMRAEEQNRAFLNDIKALQEINLELGEIDSLDALYIKMIEVSQHRMGLDRMGLFIIDPVTGELHGTYGVDKDGNIRDERYYHEEITADHWTLEIANAHNHSILWEDAPIYDDGREVARGWKTAAALWNGHKSIGYIVSDNFTSQRPPRSYEIELASLLGSTFGHLIERSRANDALAVARDQALEASRLKSQLLAKVSHELRTPLGGILGYAELLQFGAFGTLEDKQLEAAAQIIDSANYLNNMVNELLDEAQIEAKTITLRKELFAPSAILQQLDAQMSILAHKKELSFSASLAPDTPQTLIGDEHRLKQIVINLTGNAIKFTKTGGVSVKMGRTDGSHWFIQVADTGAGIPKEAQGYIFEPFRQVDNSITRENRGTGLGLSITKQLVELMGGKITLESEVDKGSTFTIHLPITEKTEN